MGDTPNALKSCDTIPAPQNLAVRVGSRQRLQSFSASTDVDDRLDWSRTATSSASPALIPGRSSGGEGSSTSVATSLPFFPAGKIITPSPVPPARHLCMRHMRTADEGTNRQLQTSLDSLPIADRQMINTLWSMYSSSAHSNRAIILKGILTMCCSSQLSLLSEQVPQLLRIDPFYVFPREIGLRVLKYLDAQSLARAAQVSRTWKLLADDDILWRNMCEQHIEKKCAKCGWGLPLLEKKRSRRGRPVPPTSSSLPLLTTISTNKRRSPFSGVDEDPSGNESQSTSSHQSPVSKRRKLLDSSHQTTPMSSPEPPSSSELGPETPIPSSISIARTRPWKDVYSERQKIERNWRRGRYTVTTLKGHTDGVMCLQLNENLSHPSFPVLISGSYDRTVRVWNLETGREIAQLIGHTRAVRALQFDEVKLITASMDHTLRVWNWRTGQCIRVLEGHAEGVVSLQFDADVLASGSVDTTVKIWNLRKGDCFTLRGHEDWVNAVKIWDPNGHHGGSSPSSASDDTPMMDSDELASGSGNRAKSPVDSSDMVGKMLFSASDDCTIRLWDLNTRNCVREFKGHVGQVQSIKMVYTEDDERQRQTHPSVPSSASGTSTPQQAASSSANPFPSVSYFDESDLDHSTGPRPLLISGSLDNTLKLWDVESGKELMTYFGHIEGVWAIASDKLRVVSASHDRTLKIWDRENDKSSHTLVGHRGAVTCLDLAGDKIVSGSDDAEIKVWSFAPSS